MNQYHLEKINLYKTMLMNETKKGNVDAVIVLEKEFNFLTTLCDHRYPTGRSAYVTVVDKPLCQICLRKNLR